MKNRYKSVILFLTSLCIFIVGVGIFVYPFVSNFINERNQREVISVYDDTVSKMHEDELKKQWNAAKVYNDNLAGDPLHDPFVVNSGYAVPNNYLSVLNVNDDGVMGYIDIPKIDVYLPIYHGTDEEVLQKGAGHLEGTSLPIGGVNRFSVISAHRGLPSSELFTRLDEMEIGDIFFIHVLDEKLCYQVDRIDVIDPEDLSLVRGEEDKDIVTLLTCTPYAVNTHRMLVRGVRISYVEEESLIDDLSEDKSIAQWLKEYIFSIFIGIAVVVCIVFVWKKKSKKDERND